MHAVPVGKRARLFDGFRRRRRKIENLRILTFHVIAHADAVF